MPVHDWTRVSAGTFHDFHNAWIIHLKEALNAGILPKSYYALSEQHASLGIPDILTLHAEDNGAPGDDGGVALLTAPPKVGRRLIATEIAMTKVLRRTLTIRRVSGHRIVAMIEIASPGNKDRAESVEEFVSKAIAAIDHGIHVLLIDLLAPTPFDPHGLHGGIWASFGDVEPPPADRPITLASYAAIRAIPEAIEVHLRVGDPLPSMPLYVIGHRYIETPLEATYQAAFRGMPEYWRDVLTKTP
jgi:uncharacterized protein DUF4058